MRTAIAVVLCLATVICIVHAVVGACTDAGTCSGHGTCTVTDTCACFSNWIGQNCSVYLYPAKSNDGPVAAIIVLPLLVAYSLLFTCCCCRERAIACLSSALGKSESSDADGLAAVALKPVSPPITPMPPPAVPLPQSQRRLPPPRAIDPYAPTVTDPVLAQRILSAPVEWDAGSAGRGITVYERSVTFHRAQGGSEFAMVLCQRGWAPVSPFVYYFEITVQTARIPRAAQIAVGLAHGNVSRQRMIGWDSATYGYHGDDGVLFQDNRTTEPAGGPVRFGLDDVVGCGLIGPTREVFFTCNGALVGKLGPISERIILFPCVSFHNSNDSVQANWTGPFRFQPTSMLPAGSEPAAAAAAAADDTSAADAGSTPASLPAAGVAVAAPSAEVQMLMEMTTRSQSECEDMLARYSDLNTAAMMLLQLPPAPSAAVPAAAAAAAGPHAAHSTGGTSDAAAAATTESAPQPAEEEKDGTEGGGGDSVDAGPHPHAGRHRRRRRNKPASAAAPPAPAPSPPSAPSAAGDGADAAAASIGILMEATCRTREECEEALRRAGGRAELAAQYLLSLPQARGEHAVQSDDAPIEPTTPLPHRVDSVLSRSTLAAADSRADAAAPATAAATDTVTVRVQQLDGSLLVISDALPSWTLHRLRSEVMQRRTDGRHSPFTLVRESGVAIAGAALIKTIAESGVAGTTLRMQP